MELPECCCVRPRSLFVIGDGIICEKPRPHGAHAIRCQRHASLRCFRRNSIRDRFRSRLELWIDLGCVFLVLGVFSMFYIRERRLWVWKIWSVA